MSPIRNMPDSLSHYHFTFAERLALLLALPPQCGRSFWIRSIAAVREPTDGSPNLAVTGAQRRRILADGETLAFRLAVRIWDWCHCQLLF